MKPQITKRFVWCWYKDFCSRHPLFGHHPLRRTLVLLILFSTLFRSSKFLQSFLQLKFRGSKKLFLFLCNVSNACIST